MGDRGGPHTGSVQFIFWAELHYLLLPAFRAFDCHSACRLRCKWDELPSSPPRSSARNARRCISRRIHRDEQRSIRWSFAMSFRQLRLSTSSFFVHSLIFSYRPFFFPDTLDLARDARFNEPRRIILRGYKFSVLRAASARLSY